VSTELRSASRVQREPDNEPMTSSAAQQRNRRESITRQLHLIAGAVPLREFLGFSIIFAFIQFVEDTASGEPQRWAAHCWSKNQTRIHGPLFTHTA